MIVTGTIQKLIVNRKTDIGYMLTKNDDSVFLHFNESLKQDLQSGDEVDAFIYIDGKGRQAATLKMPFITIDKPACLKVNSVIPDLGVFLDMGISKDVLLSTEDLPNNLKYWPIIGDKLWVTLRVKGKMVAKLMTKHDMDNNIDIPLKTNVDAIIMKIGQQGLNAITDDGVWLFIHESMYQGTYHLGERVSVHLTYASDRGYSGSLLVQKEEAMDHDANMILEVLKEKKHIPLDSDASPEDIKRYFGISKKAFKRAIGRLYKLRKIEFKDGKTFLKE